MRVNACFIYRGRADKSLKDVIGYPFPLKLLRNLAIHIGLMLRDKDDHSRASDDIYDKHVGPQIKKFLKSNESDLLIVNQQTQFEFVSGTKTEKKIGNMLLVSKEHSPFFNLGLIDLGAYEELNPKTLKSFAEYFDNLDETSINKYIIERN